MVMPVSLQTMQVRAQRQLDGMTVNRDEMARDVLFLCEVVRAARNRIRDLERATVKEDDPLNLGIFKDLFK
jgi:hypothetical protein